MNTVKFSRLEKNQSIVHDYGDLFYRQPCGDSQRLVIGPSGDHVNLITELSSHLKGDPWFVLYVLVVPRLGRKPGRYQSQLFHQHSDLKSFLSKFKDLFESDARHHVWVGSAQNDGMLIYDNHNIILGYGPLGRYESVLRNKGFKEQKFSIPAPHTHSFWPANDQAEDLLMQQFDWKHFPLQPQDDP